MGNFLSVPGSVPNDFFLLDRDINLFERGERQYCPYDFPLFERSRYVQKIELEVLTKFSVVAARFVRRM